ncbi:4'-phosphopantetheinyl transferase superfamily protein [Eubacteriales bacterium OttesenSCG-928-G02]|nr:4'-phosphopantetheinyl transferase superfamily protein [Eubacteriales bacterium OttesenSCG-928-G02]
MSLKTLVLDNDANKEVRHKALLNAVRTELQSNDVEIEYTEKGKPNLVGVNKYISVTTTGDVMLCVLSDAPVGVDGEQLSRFTEIDSKIDFLALAERFFTEDEADYVRYNDSDALSFARIWVRKEAYSKFTGKGLVDFQNFSVTNGERLYSKVSGIPVKTFYIDFPGSEDYIFAIAGTESSVEEQEALDLD